MNLKLSPYHIYQTVALVLIGGCWLWLSLVAPTRYTIQANACLQSLEADAQQQAQDYAELWHKTIEQKVASQDKGYELFPVVRHIHLRKQRLLRQIRAYKTHLRQSTVDRRKTEELTTGIVQYINWVAQQYKSLGLLHDSTEFAQYTQLSTDDFIKKYFDQANVTEALLEVNYWQHKVWLYGARLLYVYGSEPSGYFDKYIQTRAFNAPQYIEVGDTLSADLFCGFSGLACALGQSEHYYVEINGVRRLPNQTHTFPVSFRVNGKGKQYWTGKLVYCQEGIEKTQVIKTNYWVQQ